MSLRTRLLLALLGVVAAGLLVAGAATYLSLRSFLLERVDDQLRDARGPVAAALASDLSGGSTFDLANRDVNLPPGTFGQVRYADGDIIGSRIFSYSSTTDFPVPDLPEPLLSEEGDAAQVFTVSSVTGSTQFRVLAQEVSQVERILIVAIPLSETQQTLSRLLRLEVIVSVSVLAALMAGAWLIIKRDLRPLEHMAVTADAIAAGDLTRRVQPAEPRTEVGRLGLSLNTMLTRIEEAFAERAATEEKLRRFLADASHELRTPLTSIRGYAEVFERAKEDPENLELAMRRIEEESKRMGVMVEELLVLARIGECREPERELVDLARVVIDAVSDARTATPSRNITLEAAETAEVLGDDHQLRQVVANLLSNAVRHTPGNAQIRVRLTAASGHGMLSVSDDGPGLEPEMAAKVFEPFYRADTSRTRETGGAGLGLAIVAAIVEAHDGTVRLDTTPGVGATFIVDLPLGGTGPAHDDPPSEAPDGEPGSETPDDSTTSAEAADEPAASEHPAGEAASEPPSEAPAGGPAPKTPAGEPSPSDPA